MKPAQRMLRASQKKTLLESTLVVLKRIRNEPNEALRLKIHDGIWEEAGSFIVL